MSGLLALCIALSVLIFVILIGKAFLVEGLADAPWPHVVRIVLNCFMVSVAMIVMAVPEGLPMSITLSLALSMRRMLKTNNLVRKMHACETMGAVTVICTDKTGTLTQNRMRMQEIIRYGLPDERLLGESVAANSTAFLDADGRPLGNPTEGALLEWLRRENGDYAALREGVRILTGYLICSLFTFQHVLSTPFVFALLGMAEGVLCKDVLNKS